MRKDFHFINRSRSTKLSYSILTGHIMADTHAVHVHGFRMNKLPLVTQCANDESYFSTSGNASGAAAYLPPHAWDKQGINAMKNIRIEKTLS